MSHVSPNLSWAVKLLESPSRKRGRLAGAPPWDGRIVEVEPFWEQAWRALRRRQRDLARVARLAHARWSVDQSAGLIQFERPDGSLATAPVQIVGVWNGANGSFAWGWDHPSVRTRLRTHAERTRWFGEAHGLPQLTESRVAMSEAQAWRATALTVHVNGAVGAYRGPTEGGPTIFMTLGDITER
jgi:hypothetical protein